MFIKINPKSISCGMGSAFDGGANGDYIIFLLSYAWGDRSAALTLFNRELFLEVLNDFKGHWDYGYEKSFNGGMWFWERFTLSYSNLAG